MDQMIDIFGTDIIVVPSKDDSFSITVNTSKTGAIYLAQLYLDAIEIIYPNELRKEFLKELEIKTKQYKKAI